MAIIPKAVAKEIPVEQLTRGTYQPRQQFDTQALQELAETIKNVGILEPLIVRSKTATTYEIIAGERRWRAAQLAGLDIIPCFVSSYTDEQAIQIALIENLSRQDLNPIEEAQAIARLIEEFEYTHEMAASVLGKPRTEITNLLRLLKLDGRVRTLIVSGDLSESHGKLLAGLPISKQYDYGHRAAVKGWSIRALEKAIKQEEAKTSLTALPLKQSDKNLERLERQLSDHLGASVRFTMEKNNSGQVNIRFNSLDELDGILERVGYKP